MIKFNKYRHAREGGYPRVGTVPFVEMDSRLRENDGDLTKRFSKEVVVKVGRISDSAIGQRAIIQ
ncbi:MAG: hypothetical protein V3U78_07665 [Thiotrichaceae bacterium]